MGKNNIIRNAHMDLRAKMAKEYQLGTEPAQIYTNAHEFSGISIEHLKRVHPLREIREFIRENNGELVNV